ncbi:MAG TPA: PH domain-containing protein [Bradyrhizobium sp.]|uniref:PH domain-containing protein n=1 Tax=Bradyrhizobium sp. TaxID=376 RepID=UPI002D80BC35|nr:PH domain-containing protein [Bradyrhizobium sp.]HET7887207.1 PH domain-containing protein [Bradyrhizobium sp.]
MARYIDEILQPGEKVLYSTNAHWIFYLPAIVAWLVTLVLLIISVTVAATIPAAVLASLAGAAVIAAVAVFYTVRGWFHRLTTETDVTDRRVVHKTGFINRHTFEIALDKIASVEVDQSISGRLLNYGDVSIVGMGEVPPQVIKTIASPLAFRSAITAH